MLNLVFKNFSWGLLPFPPWQWGFIALGLTASSMSDYSHMCSTVWAEMCWTVVSVCFLSTCISCGDFEDWEVYKNEYLHSKLRVMIWFKLLGVLTWIFLYYRPCVFENVVKSKYFEAKLWATWSSWWPCLWQEDWARWSLNLTQTVLWFHDPSLQGHKMCKESVLSKYHFLVITVTSCNHHLLLYFVMNVKMIICIVDRRFMKRNDCWKKKNWGASKPC